jgi:hypothetical protein
MLKNFCQPTLFQNIFKRKNVESFITGPTIWKLKNRVENKESQIQNPSSKNNIQGVNGENTKFQRKSLWDGT